MTQHPDPSLFTRDGKPRRRAVRPRAIPVTADMLEGAPDFAPAPRGASRYDGWTPDRQHAFIKALAETGVVSRAAAIVGMRTTGAYQLRKADGAEGFRAAWDEALAHGVQRLADIAYERAVYGVETPVFYHGEKIAERRVYDNRLLSWVLRHRDPETHGGTGGDRIPPHVRKALRAQWEREKAAEEQLRAEQEKAYAQSLTDKLRQMASRMKGQPREGSSVASFVAWAMFGPPDPEEVPADWDGDWHPRSGFSPAGEALAEGGEEGVSGGLSRAPSSLRGAERAAAIHMLPRTPSSRAMRRHGAPRRRIASPHPQ